VVSDGFAVRAPLESSTRLKPRGLLTVWR